MVSAYPWTHGVRLCVPWILGLLVAAFAAGPANAQQQGSGYAGESLFIVLFLNGDALVEYDVSVADPLSEAIRIQLPAKRSVSNLIVVDYDDNVVPYTIGSNPTEIILNTPGVPNVRISYTAQDLVDRSEGRWIFSLNTATGFSVRLPRDSVLIDSEPQPAIRIIASQYLLTFDNPGATRFMYVIGVLGTEDQANIVIRLADTTIKEVSESHPGITLTNAKNLLQQAMDARDEDKFAEAETLAGQANDAAVAAGRDYEAAQNAIQDAETQIQAAAGENRDTATARTLLQQANEEFAKGGYVAARNAAEDAIEAIGDTPAGPEMPVPVIVAASVAAAGGIGALLFLRKRKPAPALQKRAVAPDDPPAPNKAALRTPVPETRTKVEEREPEEAMSDGSPPLQVPSTLPDSQTDRGALSMIVSRIVEERPHLRPEDQDVLKYLAEKEGAAFESEIRTRFQLPKTTIWRLVKRLEREELVEIRKAGGQNLIKLKFEDLQA